MFFKNGQILSKFCNKIIEDYPGYLGTKLNFDFSTSSVNLKKFCMQYTIIIQKPFFGIMDEYPLLQKLDIFCRNWSYKSGQCKVGGLKTLSVIPLQRICVRYHTNLE